MCKSMAQVLHLSGFFRSTGTFRPFGERLLPLTVGAKGAMRSESDPHTGRLGGTLAIPNIEEFCCPGMNSQG